MYRGIVKQLKYNELWDVTLLASTKLERASSTKHAKWIQRRLMIVKLSLCSLWFSYLKLNVLRDSSYLKHCILVLANLIKKVMMQHAKWRKKLPWTIIRADVGSITSLTIRSSMSSCSPSMPQSSWSTETFFDLARSFIFFSSGSFGPLPALLSAALPKLSALSTISSLFSTFLGISI